MKLNLILNLIG